MSTKGEVSKNKILDVAQQMFSTNGFGKVTMQDICRKANISRGGLYRYFGSTEDIFAAIIEREQIDALGFLKEAQDNQISPTDILSTFLEIRVNSLLQSDMAFDNALAEYAAVSESGKKILMVRASTSIDILSRIIQAGCNTGDFKCNAPENVAIHLLWVLDGIAKHNTLIPLTKEEALCQLRMCTHFLGAKKDIV